MSRFSFKAVVHVRSLAVMLGIPILASTAMAGAWVPEPGRGYHKLAVNHFRATEGFGSASDVDSFTNTNLSYYGEVGVATRLALFGTASLVRLDQDTGIDETDFFGVGDVEVGVRAALVEDPFVLSTAFTFKAPYFYNEDASLPPGNGQEDFELRLLFGKSFDRLGYIGLEGGYRFRLEDPSDEFRYLVEYGVPITDRLYFRTKLDAIQSIGNGDESSTGVGNPQLNPEFDLGKLELTGGWKLGSRAGDAKRGGWGLEATYTRDLYGRNTLQGDTVQFGIVFTH